MFALGQCQSQALVKEDGDASGLCYCTVLSNCHVLGPLLFLLYTTDLGELAASLSLSSLEVEGVPRRVNTDLCCVGSFRRFLREFECGYF